MPDSLTSYWHWRGFGTISKSIEVRNAAMDGSGNWGNRYHLDPVAPNETANFDGAMLTLSEVMDLRTLANTPLGTTSGTTVLWQSWEGLIVGFDPGYIDGTYYYGVRLSLLNCTVTGP